MTKAIAVAAFAMGIASGPALAAEPDGLILPPGFHASVVAEGLGPIRHMAIRGNGDIYVSDGYGNSRVHKYSPDGKLLFSWGAPGTAAAEPLAVTTFTDAVWPLGGFADNAKIDGSRVAVRD